MVVWTQDWLVLSITVIVMLLGNVKNCHSYNNVGEESLEGSRKGPLLQQVESIPFVPEDEHQQIFVHPIHMLSPDDVLISSPNDDVQVRKRVIYYFSRHMLALQQQEIIIHAISL